MDEVDGFQEAVDNIICATAMNTASLAQPATGAAAPATTVSATSSAAPSL